MFTAKSVDEMKTFAKSIDKEIDSMKVLSDMYTKTIIDDTDKKNWDEFIDSYNKYMDQIKMMRDELYAGKKDEALVRMNVTSKPLASLSRNNLDKVVDYNILTANKISEENKADADKTGNIILISIIFSIVLAIILGMFLANIISKPINIVLERLEKLSSYDLSNLKKGAEDFAQGKLDIDIKTDPEKLEVKSEDETGETFGND